MSRDCGSINQLPPVPISSLNPKWVEFTKTLGALRVLQEKDHVSRAQGMVLTCPLCKGDSGHLLIFLFNFDGVPHTARPHPRFSPAMKAVPAVGPVDLHHMTLLQTGPPSQVVLIPGDTLCGWKGTIQQGVVSWEIPAVKTVAQKLKKISKRLLRK